MVGAVLFATPQGRQVADAVGVYGPVVRQVNRLQRAYVDLGVAQCLTDLQQMDMTIRSPRTLFGPHACGVIDGVRVEKIGAMTLVRAPVMSCRLARALGHFVTDHLQPTAQQDLGAPVVQMSTVGTYNCRSIRPRPGLPAGGVLSQHAFANAIDVSGFMLGNGKKLSVLRDWPKAGAEGKFLHHLAGQACRAFAVALSPDADANHRGHFHWDAGLWIACR